MSTAVLPATQLVPPTTNRRGSIAERVLLMMLAMISRSIARTEQVAEARRKDGAIHWVIVVAIIVALAIAASLVAAGIAMCAAQGGVLEFVVQLDPWTVEFHCKKL